MLSVLSRSKMSFVGNVETYAHLTPTYTRYDDLPVGDTIGDSQHLLETPDIFVVDDAF